MDKPIDPLPAGVPDGSTPFDMLRKKFNDPDLTDEILIGKLSTEGAKLHGTVPPVFFMYNHAGYDKHDMSMTFGLNPYTALIEKAVEPPGEAKPEWEIFSLLMSKISERAQQRSMNSFVDRRGKERLYRELYKRFTLDGYLATQEDALKEMVNAAQAIGSFPEGFDYEKFKEAGEAFPVHKDTPPIGGNYPFKIVSGHVRGSIHSMHSDTPEFLRLHRGQPLLFINDQVARDKGINDADMVRMFNDLDEAELMACTSSSVGPGQVLVYMFESWQFKNWKSHDAMLIGMPKFLQLAGDYHQLAYRIGQGSPSPSNDRGLRVDIALATT